MKLKTIISPDSQEEIVIHCKERNDKIKRIEGVIENLINEDAQTVLFIAETEYFVPYKKILFFEMQNGKVTAHTKDKMFISHSTLAKLEETLPHYFIRGSKSCIINAQAVSGISHNVAGPSKVYFSATDKIVYVSRSYYKFLKEKIYLLKGL